MVRYEIPGSPISVGYGYDHCNGVFLSVFDSRLKYDKHATDEVNAVTESIGVRDGGGSYFDLHTGENGFGLKVDHSTMVTFLRRYGAPEDRIHSLPLILPSHDEEVDSSTRLCPTCTQNVASKACSKCHDIKYCSKQCQAKDWAFHKLFCNIASMSQPSTLNEETSVVAVLLPVDSKKPILVRIPHQWKCLDEDDEEEEHFWSINTKDFIQLRSTVRSDLFPEEKQRKLKYGFHIAHEDDFLVNSSIKVNQCIQHIFQQKKCGFFSPWGGNVLLIKAEKQLNPMYGDLLRYEDMMDAIDFLIDYSVASYAA